MNQIDPVQPRSAVLTGRPVPGGSAQGLVVQGLRKEYGRVLAVDELDLEIPQGAMLSLLGPSGCGKTTTLHMIAGLVSPSAGRIWIAGRDMTVVPPHRRGLGMVFQDYALYPYRTVRENVAFPLELAGVPRTEIGSRVSEELARVQLTDHGSRRPRELSGGQQQRVALARALVKRPALLLFDEPLSNLDASLRAEMRELIVDIHLEIGATSVFVTHDQEEAMAISDLVAVMDHGRVVQLGTPRIIYDSPAAEHVARFVGRPAMRLHPARLENARLAIGGTDVGEVGIAATATRVTAGVRPENVYVDRQPSPRVPIPARVQRVERGGADDYLEVLLGESASLMARIKPGTDFDRGDQLYIGVEPGSWRVFDAETGLRVPPT